MSSQESQTYGVIIIGGGAAGLMCAMTAGNRGRSVAIIERNPNIGEKIRISGGGRCNFTNINAGYESFLSGNTHFCKSALSRFTPNDFIALVEKHGISYHEKKLGQLFCDGSSREIIMMLVKECTEAGVKIITGCEVVTIERDSGFKIQTSTGVFESESLVIATGGLSIPKLGATDFGYRIARQFDLNITETKPGLVPFTFGRDVVSLFEELSGVSLDAIVTCKGVSFRENILFTHRGLSGPAILQISSYRDKGDSIIIDCAPDIDVLALLKEHHQSKQELTTILSEILPKRFVSMWCERYEEKPFMNQYSNKELSAISSDLHHWEMIPSGTEGYAKAEVTCGGIDTNELSSKTMEAKRVPGLFFIGEVVDVTGHLGGFNFQWAWASGVAAGEAA